MLSEQREARYRSRPCLRTISSSAKATQLSNIKRTPPVPTELIMPRDGNADRTGDEGLAAVTAASSSGIVGHSVNWLNKLH
jgi:hypothetical protein